MSIAEPIPDLQWGRGDWQDYINNWREKDAEYLQARTILRYQTAAARTTDWPSPAAGQVTYNAALDTLEMYSTARSAYLHLLMFANLVSTSDTTTGVNISHASAGGKGATFTPTNVVIDAPANLMNGMLAVDANSVMIQSSGQKQVKLTTDSDELLSDTPMALASIRLTGTGTVVDATGKTIVVGTLTATTVNASGNVTATGNVSGAQVSGTSRGTFNGVDLGYDAGLTTPAGSASRAFASNGLVSQQGMFYGDATSAVVRQRTPTTGVLGNSFLQVSSTDINFGPVNSANNVYMYPYLRIMQGRGVPWHNTAGTHVAWIAPVIVSASDPGAANFPDGTVWITP